MSVESKYYPDFVKSLPSLKGKRIAITGTTSGTGLIAALTVAKLGAQVVMINRPSKRVAAAVEKVKSEVKDADVSTIDCDLQDFKSVTAAAATFKKNFPEGGLDVLVNNAGIMAVVKKATTDGFDQQIQTNHLSHFLLTRELYPELVKAAKKNGEARVVNQTSNARHGAKGSFNADFFGKDPEKWGDEEGGKWARYYNSKFANIVFSMALKDRFTEANVNILALTAHPGLSATSLFDNMVAQNKPEKKSDSEKKLSDMQSGEDGTCPLLSCIALKDLKTGDFFGPDSEGGSIGPGTYGKAIKLKYEPVSDSKENKDSLWEESEKAIGGKFSL